MLLVRCVACIPRRIFVAGRALRVRVPLLALLSLLLVSMLVAAPPARAAAPAVVAASCGLALEIIAAPYAVVDSNNPGVQGPRVATLSAPDQYGRRSGLRAAHLAR